MSEQRTDNRQVNHVQVYRSEFLTLARTISRVRDEGNLTLSAMARIKVIKSDLRLPTTVTLAFDPDGGNPDNASITSRPNAVGDNGQEIAFKVSVSELVLARRSYVPILKVVGSTLSDGLVDVPARPGALGFAWRLSNECDAVEIRARLPHALGEVKIPGDTPEYWAGRWIVGYSFTTNDRLSREEWTAAVCGTNMSIEVYGEPNTLLGIPNIIKELPS